MKKILIIQTAFIGDVILATALLESLYAEFGNHCKIDLVVRKGNEGLFKNHPFLNTCFVWDKKQGKYKGLLAVIKQIRKTKYDYLYNLQRYASTGFMSLRAKAVTKVGYKKNPLSFCYNRKYKHTIGNGQHEVERNFELIKPELTSPKKAISPRLYGSEADQLLVDELLLGISDYYVFAPASVWFTKQLPVEKWIELGKQVASSATIFFVGAPTDKELIATITKQLNNVNTVNLAGKLTLIQSALLMKKAKRSFVNDSAPLHLASAMNAPVTAFFCSTIPAFGFGPLSTNSTVIEAKEQLACRPCGLHGHKSCPKNHFKCGNQIVPILN